MRFLAPVGALVLAAGMTVACSGAEDAGAPAPTPDESAAVEEATAMIPEAERAPSEPAPTAEVSASTAAEPLQPKKAYQTPVPGPSPAQ